MADIDQKDVGFFQSLRNMIAGSGKELAQDNSSGGKMGEVIRAVSDSRGAEPLWAAWRQGADELGQALKAFPDSIQAQPEPGGMFEPLHHDLVAARDLPSPSQIGNESKSTGTVHGRTEVSKQQTASPGEIAREGKGTVHGRPEGERNQSPSPSDIASGRGGAAEPWTQQEQDRTAGKDGSDGNNQNEQAQGRSPADEQRQQGRGRGR